MLSIGLLGGWSVRIDSKHIKAELGPSGRRLSAFLAHTAGRSYRRDKLAEMFWSDMDPDRAKAALNTALWRLRRLLATVPQSKGGKNLVTLGEEIALETADWLHIDSSRFDTGAKAALKGPYGNQAVDKVEALAGVASLYAGPFMDGEQEDWVLVERERLHSLYVRVGHELARVHTQNGDLDEAIQVLRSVLAADPFRESTHRDQLLLMLLNGQRAEALRTHERWALSIGRELGIRPMPQTEQLIGAIRANKPAEWLEKARADYLSGGTRVGH
jgi:DNA-binding SARP family transcriptional activator